MIYLDLIFTNFQLYITFVANQFEAYSREFHIQTMPRVLYISVINYSSITKLFFITLPQPSLIGEYANANLGNSVKFGDSGTFAQRITSAL